jgi:signal transduction histidine kinase
MTNENEKQTILAVDDDFISRTVIKELIINCGYSILVAESSKTAFSVLASNPIDLILLDVSMPDMDGFSICRKIKEELKYCDIPVIFLTSRHDRQSITDGFAAGGVDYIIKPFEHAELVARVKTHLNLRQTLKKLEESNITKKKLFSIIGHDLNNPLQDIQFTSTLLLRDFSNIEDTKKIEYITSISQSCKQIAHLLKNLLHWSKSQMDQLNNIPQPIHLKQIAQESIELLKSESAKKDIAIHLEVKTNSPAFADLEMVRTIMRNLLTNAVKFTPQKGQVKISIKPMRAEIEISVLDTGVGLQAERIKDIFSIQNHQITRGTHGEKGIGIGLTICKELVEKCNGRILVESKPNKGSHFKFTLPKYIKNQHD